MVKVGENIRQRKDGRWLVRCKIGFGDDGKIIYRHIYGHSYEECKDKLALFKAQHPNKIVRPKFTGKFAELAALWLKHAQLTVKESSYATYIYLINKYLVPRWGEKTILDMKLPEIENWIQSLMKNGKKGGKSGFSYSMLTIILVVFRSILSFGDRCYQLPNPMRGFRWHEHKNFNQDKVLTKHEWDVLTSSLKYRPNDLHIALALYTGMRIGEICALQRGDIDFASETISVKRTVYRIFDYVRGHGTKIVIATPKTKDSYRTMPIPRILIKPLYRICKGKDSTDYIFGKTFRHPLDAGCLGHRFHRLLEELGLRQVNFHALRHTFATRCVECHMDIKTLSEILGHSSVQMTLDRYVHSSMNFKRKQLDHMYNVLLPEMNG